VDGSKIVSYIAYGSSDFEGGSSPSHKHPWCLPCTSSRLREPLHRHTACLYRYEWSNELVLAVRFLEGCLCSSGSACCRDKLIAPILSRMCSSFLPGGVRRYLKIPRNHRRVFTAVLFVLKASRRALKSGETPLLRIDDCCGQ
jgi:hypothetical protein